MWHCGLLLLKGSDVHQTGSTPSEGARDAVVNEAAGERNRIIAESEAERERQINVAEGEAKAILSVAEATAESLEKIGESIEKSGGEKAMQLRIAEDYMVRFGALAKEGNTIIIPSNLADMGSMIGAATSIFTGEGRGNGRNLTS